MVEHGIQPHIRCSSRDAAKYAILPGAPERVDRVAGFLDRSENIAYNREFKTVTGFYKGIRVMVTSTGIGGPSAAIALEELRNIGVETAIRIGSCGALQPDIRLGELIIAAGAVRNEGTSSAYIEKGYPAVADIEVVNSIIKSAGERGYRYHCGLVRSHDSFYTDEEESIDSYWSSRGILGADMETAAIFVVGGLRKLRTASILNVVVEYEGELKENINSLVDGERTVAEGEEREITAALEAIVKLENAAFSQMP
jgi:uridine phosphorylase